MKNQDFELYQSLLQKNSGLTIGPDKTYLLESRLTPIAKKWGYTSLDDMTRALHKKRDEKLITQIIEAMATNETLFFRDLKPFKLFEEVVLPHMFENRRPGQPIKIWCAAASTGQEPYSLAMVLKDNEDKLKGRKCEILATDISNLALEKAREAKYTQFEVQRGMSVQYLMKYFTQDGDKWRLRDEIRNMVKFDYFNLLGDMSRLGTFDVIFCRNVLIYFDEATKRQVLQNLAGRLVTDGFLFLGGAETVLGITDKFKPVSDKRGIYVHNSTQAPAAEGAKKVLERSKKQ